MNKRGVVADDIPPLMFAVLGVGLLIIIAIGAKMWTGPTQEKIATSLQRQADSIALVHNYLQGDIEYNGQTQRVASFMATADVGDAAVQATFQNHVKAFFEPHMTADCWFVQVRPGPDTGGSPLLDAGKSPSACENEFRLIEYSIPLSSLNQRTVRVVIGK